MARKMIRRVFINKKTKQLSVTIPKKKLSKRDITLTEGKDLFVSLEILHKKPRRKK